MNRLLPLTTTATELQRNYRKVIKMVKKSKEPVTVLSNNRPEIVVMDYDAFKTNITRKEPKKSAKHSRSLDEFFGIWSKEEADEFDRVIEEMFEQVNPEGWK